MTQKERRARFLFAHIPGLGPAARRDVLNAYGSISAFLEDKNGKVYKKFAAAIDQARRTRDEIDTEEFVVYGEAAYPYSLQNTPDAPTVLFFKGDIGIAKQHAVAVVGTRRMTHTGKQHTIATASAIVAHEMPVISGLAFGVDTIAHKESQAQNGKTVAVLGTGINQPYPRRNKKLYESISANGLVLSEYFRTKSYDRFVFPRRNRIVAGLAKATVVTEAPAKSGALITARLAFDYGRDVFAFPYTPTQLTGAGCNNLIANHVAQLVGAPEDGFRYLADVAPTDASLPTGQHTVVQSEILTLIKIQPRSFEQLTESVNIPSSDLRSELMALQMLGDIHKSATGLYSA